MSDLVVPDVAENNLQALWLASVSSLVKLALFKNNLTPGSGTVFGDFTKGDFTGYADVTVTMGAPATVGGKSTITATGVASFIMGTPGTGNTIFGYYVFVPSTTILLWAERFDNSQVIANAGDEIDITLVFTLFSEF